MLTVKVTDAFIAQCSILDKTHTLMACDAVYIKLWRNIMAL